MTLNYHASDLYKFLREAVVPSILKDFEAKIKKLADLAKIEKENLDNFKQSLRHRQQVTRSIYLFFFIFQ